VLNASIRVHAGRLRISRTGDTVKGTLYGITPSSTPHKYFVIGVPIDDLGGRAAAVGARRPQAPGCGCWMRLRFTR